MMKMEIQKNLRNKFSSRTLFEQCSSSNFLQLWSPAPLFVNISEKSIKSQAPLQWRYDVCDDGLLSEVKDLT